MSASNAVWQMGAALTAAGMTAGAFGAHALKTRLQASGKPENWHIASNYLIFSGLGLLAISQHPRFGRNHWAARLIAGGALVFSGSIFGLVLDPRRFGKVLGPITPLGGAAMISGFISLALA